MQTPPLSHRQFQVLSALIDGRERRICELKETLGLTGEHGSFYERIRAMHVDGLLEKTDAVLRRQYSSHGNPVDNRRKFQKARLLRITEEGKRAWRETADFYLFLIEQFAGESPARPDGEDLAILTRTDVPPDREGEERRRDHARSWIARMRRLNKSLNRNGGKSCKRQ